MSKTALLIMDLQTGILDRVPTASTLLPLYATTIASARASSIPIIYIKLGFRPHHPDISPHNKIAGFSAFASTDLELVLRSLGVQGAVVAGVSTSGVVLSSVREPADRDYGVTVLRDLCFDGDEEVHRVLVEKVFPKQADVVTAGEWVAGLKGVEEVKGE
ncbi:hypothetical protein VE04_03261 [Pseudogymnoascus sp. 24MN13]|nr:hypothetical protein VE04_03261 [Pseudogymnoascus sp. 24MN13]